MTTGKAQPFRMRIEGAKVQEFARATGYPSEDARDCSPPTFLITQVFWKSELNDAIVHGDDLPRTLHASEEFEFVGPPPPPGTALTGQSSIAVVTRKTGRRGGDLFFTEVLTEFVDDTGALVVRNRSTTVVTSAPPRGK